MDDVCMITRVTPTAQRGWERIPKPQVGSSPCHLCTLKLSHVQTLRLHHTFRQGLKILQKVHCLRAAAMHQRSTPPATSARSNSATSTPSDSISPGPECAKSASSASGTSAPPSNTQTLVAERLRPRSHLVPPAPASGNAIKLATTIKTEPSLKMACIFF